jgi:hypothetical protein
MANTIDTPMMIAELDTAFWNQLLAQEHGQRRHVEVEVFEKGFAFIEQDLDGRRNCTLDENGEGLADFSVGSRPLGTEGEDLFELIEDQVGYPILALAVVEIEPETAGGVVGQHQAGQVDAPQSLKGDPELFKRGVFSFAVADAIEGRASSEFLQVRNESCPQEARFSQPAATVED